MADLIDRQALLNDIQAAADNGGMGAVVAGTLKRYVKRAPAVDAVEVVRCDKCIYSNSCKIEAMLLDDGIENPYCAGGERREENAAD